jgi:hypothetical protein
MNREPTRLIRLAAALLVGALAAAHGQALNRYAWTVGAGPREEVGSRIAPPPGFVRTVVAPGSFPDWLRHLPLKPAGAPVRLFNGAEKGNQTAHAAVVDIDIGSRDLQQCADAVIRLRAEYLYAKGLYAAIRFTFTSGHPAPYVEWRQGLRPQVAGNQVRWVKSAEPDASYASFRTYLESVFVYAGTLSLSRELPARRRVEEMQAGDVFVRGGSPGHAVIVIDMAQHPRSGEQVFLLAQSYMPAQDVHILVNPNDRALSPWYPVRFGETLRTPEWEFSRTDLRHFPAGLPPAEPVSAGVGRGG